MLTAFGEFKATSLYCQNILQHRGNIPNSVYLVDQYVEERKIESNFVENTALQSAESTMMSFESEVSKKVDEIDPIIGKSAIPSLTMDQPAFSSSTTTQNQGVSTVLAPKRKYTRKAKQTNAIRAQKVEHIADKPIECERTELGNIPTKRSKLHVNIVAPSKRKYIRKTKQTNAEVRTELENNPTKTSKLIRHYTRKLTNGTNEIKEKKIYHARKSPCEFCGKLMVLKELKEHLNTHYGK